MESFDGLASPIWILLYWIRLNHPEWMQLEISHRLRSNIHTMDVSTIDRENDLQDWRHPLVIASASQCSVTHRQIVFGFIHVSHTACEWLWTHQDLT